MSTRTGTQQTGVGNTGSSCSTGTQQYNQNNQASSTPTVNNTNFRERVAMRAYEKWVKSGCQHGCDRQNWLEAERELIAEQARSGNTGLTYYR